MIIVEANQEVSEVALMFFIDPIDELLRRNTLSLSAEHNGGAMSIIRTHIHTVMPSELLQAHPDIGLDSFHHMAEMNGAIGIGESAGYQDLS